jgi:hypothetical protein
MKRLTLALAAIGLSTASFTASAEINVSIPQFQGGLVAGITGLYSEPSSSNGDLDYVTINNNTTATTALNPQVTLKAVNPGFDFGWGANLGYVFPNTGNDVNLSYWHLNTSDSSSATAPAGGSLNSISFPLTANLQIAGGPINPLPLSITQSSAKAEFRLNQVDLTAGQYVDVGSLLEVHPFVGLRYADVKRTLSSNNSGNITSFIATALSTASTFIATGLAASESLSETSDFDGIGPLAGINFNLPIAGGFGFQGGFSGALLVGNVDSKLQSVVNVTAATSVASTGLAPNFLAGNGSFAFSSDSRRIVPNLDASLGAYYRFAFQNQSDLTLGVNYQAAEYWNAVDRLISSVTVKYVPNSILTVITPTFSTGPVTHQSANVFEQGVAVSLTYHASPTV